MICFWLKNNSLLNFILVKLIKIARMEKFTVYSPDYSKLMVC